MNNTVCAIVFDLGSTLMYFHEDDDRVGREGALDMAKFLVSRGVPADPSAFAETFLAQRASDWQTALDGGEERTCATSLTSCLAALGAPADLARLVPEAVRVYFAPEEAFWTAYPASVDVLRALHGRYRLGVLSNATDDALIQRLVNRLGFRPWVAPVFTSAHLGFRKPRPESFQPFPDIWHLRPEEIVMVGDRLDADVLGGRNAGMRTVLTTTDEPADNEAHRRTIVPDAVVDSIDDLPALLDSWKA